MKLGPITNHRLAGHVLVGRRRTFVIVGEDRRGRVLGRRPRGVRLFVLRPERWAQLERLLARVGGA